MSTEGLTSSPKKESFPVHLNVYEYDVSSINRHLCRRLGLGFYRTGIQVHGVEYMFCQLVGNKRPGIVMESPQRCLGSEGLKFWKSILIGHTAMDPFDVQTQIMGLGKDYNKNSYNLFTNNCNHFSNHACRVITGGRIPGWVNRIAKFGQFCKLRVPEEVQNPGARKAAALAKDSCGNVPSTSTTATDGSARN